MTLARVLLLGIAFLLGSIPFGLLIYRRAQGGDIREHGSGSTGASNVFRAAGSRAGLATLLLDAAKGALAVLLARWLAPQDLFVREAAAVAAVLGHVFPPWSGFRGGKGAATAAGAYSVLHPILALVSMLVFAVIAYASRYASLATVVAAGIFPLGVAVSSAPGRSVRGAAVAVALILWRHRDNMARLLRGEEATLEPPG